MFPLDVSVLKPLVNSIEPPVKASASPAVISIEPPPSTPDPDVISSLPPVPCVALPLRKVRELPFEDELAPTSSAILPAFPAVAVPEPIATAPVSPAAAVPETKLIEPLLLPPVEDAIVTSPLLMACPTPLVIEKIGRASCRERVY
jgi:hypothetical protein